ncbi:MAG: MFS transporter [Firmicutes bacterium]|jgi:OPA family glycerol-3-phosphate transporter-like MFS transporter|nr:MFS transporter [Bacillota bacterium]
MEKKFQKYKWISLMAFAMMYNLVYLGRFNVNHMMDQMAQELAFTAHQQDLISISVFIAYAAGSFINGYLADRFGAKSALVIGGGASSFLNMFISLQTQWQPILCLWLANGYFQSMIWVGGISLLANWWKEGERGKGVGIANFFSGMSHTTAYVLPSIIALLWPALDWRMNFVIPMALLLLFVCVLQLLAVERPEDKGLLPYQMKKPHHVEREAELKQIADSGKMPWKHILTQKKFLWWCAVAMLSSTCRYGLLNWIPLYYAEQNESAILSETFSNLTLPVGMAFGTLIITWGAGTKLLDNKGLIVTGMAALCGALVIIFPMITDSQTVLVGIFFTGFALYGINGILWLHAIDQGCRVFAGTAAGILNSFAYLGACAEGVLFPAAMRFFQDFMTVFVVMELLCVCMVICGMVISKKNTVVVPEVRE